MKRLLLLFLVCTMVLGTFAACAGGSDSPSDETTKKPVSTGKPSTGENTDPSGSTTEPVVTDPPIDLTKVESLTLDRNACVIFTDESGGFMVTAKNVNGDTLTGADFTYTLSDPTVATVVRNGNIVTISPLKAGRTDIAFTADGVSTTASVTVLRFDENASSKPFKEGPEKVNNIWVYHRSMLENPGLSKATAQNYAKVMDNYAAVFPNAKVTMLVAPKSSILYANDPGMEFLTDQPGIISTIYGYCSENINTVDTWTPILEHSDDYVFFASDHHWTPLGAYYAYTAFCKSIGLTPADIFEYNCELRTTDYQGTFYSFSGKDPRAAAVYDSLYLYSLPNKTVTMTIGSRTYNSCFVPGVRNYSANISGDNALTVIQVAENDPNKAILVLKDSFGCAFVPFLTEHFGTVVVVDPRHANFKLQDALSQYNFTDVVFATSIFNPSVASWVSHCNRVIGK